MSRAPRAPADGNGPGARERSRQFGLLQGKVDGIEEDVAVLKADMKAVLATLDEARGGWRALVMIAGAASVAGGAVVKIIDWFWFVPR